LSKSKSYDLDISIGRIIASNPNEVKIYANKMRDYYHSKSQASWRNKLIMVADDEDSGRYMRESEVFSKKFENNYPEFNVKKIYSDAFKQEITANGAKYPEVNKTLNREVNDGALLVNYIGHGGETGWAEEGILTLNDIRSWRNNHGLSIFVTATCEFTRFDDPGRVSAGEEVLLSDRGGAIALLSTTRLVFATSNDNLLDKLFENNFFEKNNGRHKTIGEIVRTAKNRYINQHRIDENIGKFVTFGSPALTPAFPESNVITSSINSIDINEGGDTLKALERVYLTGSVVDDSNTVISSFNGTVNISIFDKPVQLQTLRNDPGSRITPFESYQSLIYRGQTKVNNGYFEASFVVPKDIAYKIGDGKISYYATNELQDAHGVNFIPVGGTSDNPIIDNSGPEVEVFMNDTNFRFGGTVNADPFLIARIYDDNGINTVSNSIGHEPRAYLDNNEPVIFTNEFTTDLGDTRKGRINYQFFDLEEGRHRIKVVVYDVANNKGEGYTEFIVAGSNEVAIDNLLSFPNPFTSYTTFKFEHNRPDEVLNAEIQIFSSMGQLVRTIKGNINSPASVSQEFTWDGRSDYGGEVEPGVYIYRLLLTTNDGQFAKESSRVVFIK